VISIRDVDKQRLIDARNSLEPANAATDFARRTIDDVLTSIHELSQQAPVIDPRIAQMSEAEKRICYPERFA